jgi:HSP20 family protein
MLGVCAATPNLAFRERRRGAIVSAVRGVPRPLDSPPMVVVVSPGRGDRLAAAAGTTPIDAMIGVLQASADRVLKTIGELPALREILEHRPGGLPVKTERTHLQTIPVKMYRTADVLTIAAPMPGLDAASIRIDVLSRNQLKIRGVLRGALKEAKEILLDEWSIGPYHRQLRLPVAVDGKAARVTYGNGVLIVALPIRQRTTTAQLSLKQVAPTRARRVASKERRTRSTSQ